MSKRNQVEQVVKLNTKEYTEPLKRANSETKTQFTQINKQLNEAGNRFGEYSNRVKKGAAEVQKTLTGVGIAFAKNLGRGAVIGGAALGYEALKKSMKETAAVGLDFGSSFARLASRADLSKEKVKSLRDEIKRLGQTGASLASLPGALEELFGATGSMDKAIGVMDPIAKVAAIGDGDASSVARFVKDQLKGQGRDINLENTQSLLQSLVATQRGGEFKNFQEAMDAYGGLDANTIKRSGLGDKDVAGLLAGGSRAGGNKETATATLQALMKLSNDEIGGNNILGGMLGVGSMRSNGKFDISKLGSESARNAVKGLGGNDNQRIKVLSETTGLSEQEAQGLLNYINNFDEFNKGLKKTMADTKTIEQAFQESTDSLADQLGRTKNSIIKGFDDIIGPLESVGTSLLKGNVGDALKKLPGALGESGKGIMDNKGLVAGGLALTAISGVIGKKLFGMIGGEAGGLAKGVGMGKALQQMGVTPVYVVNANDIANGKNMAGVDKIGDLLGGGAAGGAASAGKMAKLLPLLKGAGLVGAAGLAGAGVGYGVNKFGIDPYTQGKTSEGFEGNAVERLIFKLDKLLGGSASGGFIKAQIEIDSKDPQFMAKPKATDVPRDAGGR